LNSWNLYPDVQGEKLIKISVVVENVEKENIEKGKCRNDGSFPFDL